MIYRQYLQYVKNTNGCATVAHFIDDYDPVGEEVWNGMLRKHLVKEIDGKIFLTDAGSLELTQ